MTPEQTLERLDHLVTLARRAGADAADAVMARGTAVSLTRRLGAVEQVERAEGADLGLRVLIGRRQAMASSSDTSPAALGALVERAVAMARAVPDDPWCGLADPGQLATSFPDLDEADPGEPSAEVLSDWAARAEDAARGVPGVTNSEGASAAHGRHMLALVASNGFARARTGTSSSISVSVLAGEGTAMERDHDHTAAVHAADLRLPEAVGREAGERAVRRLGAGRMPSARVPVVFAPRVARGLLGHLAAAINGQAVARGTTFLRDRLGTALFAPGVRIIDDPLRRRGLRSRAFDAEGLPATTRTIVEDGVLRTWILDLASARQLGLASTGHAARGVSSPPSPAVSNLYLEAGSASPEDLIADIADGLYVTELIGHGVNGVTGDYSRGAAGFRIRKGVIAGPVSEITIAGNLSAMYAALTPANDLEFRYGTDSPTVRVDGMTVAGG